MGRGEGSVRRIWAGRRIGRGDVVEALLSSDCISKYKDVPRADTEVNAGLQNTLLTDPGHFWHFNNGITVVCREIKAKMLGGRSKDSGYFNCYDVRIVNGAQTAGSIAAAR